MSPHTAKMKLLFVSSDKFPPYRVDVAVLFGEEMTARGHVIDWILQSQDDCTHAHAEIWAGGRAWVGRTDNGSTLPARLRKHAFSILHDLKMFRLMRRERYDFIQVKDKFISALWAIAATRLYGGRFVYWLSYPFPEASLHAVREGTARYPRLYVIRGAIWRFLLYRVIMRAAAHVFVQSEQMKRDVMAEGVPEDKLTVVPMGISRRMFEAPAQAQPRVLPATPAVVYLGTLLRDRRMDFLIRVFARVRESLPDAHLYLVGDGTDARDREPILAEMRRLGLEDAVTITGFMPREQALGYVREADVCVSPFFPTPILNSTSPTKLVEYFALGKPVVANDHPEQRLVIAESGGGYCVPYEEAAFADAIVALLKDPQTARAMGERGRSYVLEEREYGRIAERLERRYAQIRAAA